MAARKRLSRAEIEAQLSSAQKGTLASLYHLSTILAYSIIGGDYKPTDELRQSIGLSPYGNWLLQQGKRFDFETREARLACLLELYHLELLVDLDTTDPRAIASAISNEIKAGRIRFPMMFGPDLYHRAADLFPDERRSLSSSDTRRLLDGQPIGVFQMGRWLVGPWGVYEHATSRGIAPSHTLPLQHCHDVSCWRVHRVTLSSDPSAEIIKARQPIRKALESEGEESSAYPSVLSEILRDRAAEFNSESLGAITFLIGDSLSNAELSTLAEYLLDGPNSRVIRKRAQDLTQRVGSAKEFTADLNRAQLLQLVLLADDHELSAALDDLVFGRGGDLSINVPTHEVRRSVLTQASASDFNSRPEYSRLGLRVKSATATAPLKLRRLIDSIYFPTSGAPARERELEWQLRSVPGPSIQASLTEFLRKTQPEVVLQHLVLNTREHVELASKALGLQMDESLRNEDLVERMLWKLGFDVTPGDQLHQDFWRHSDRLRKAAEAASVSTSVGEEQISEVSASYFRALEKLLADTLVFSTWALTTDHVSQDEPYLYVDNDVALKGAGSKLGPGLAARGDISDETIGVEKWTLHPLCRGFEVLSETLESAEAKPDEFKRSATSIPDFSDQTTIQRFPFKHFYPFLDLTTMSRQRIHATLREATKSLMGSRAAEIRNGLLHYRRSNVNLENLVESLESVESVVRSLEAQGLVRIVYRQQRVETDRWGRSLHTFVDAAGSERAISRPSAYSWINLPDLTEPQHLVTIAQFDPMGEYLRFCPGSESEFKKLWAGVPRRREESVGGPIPTGQDDAPSP